MDDALTRPHALFRSLLAAVFVVVLAYVFLVEWRHWVALAFLSLILAVGLQGGATVLGARETWTRRTIVFLECVLILAATTAFWVWMGPRIVGQMVELQRRVVEGWTQLADWFQTTALADTAEEPLRKLKGSAPLDSLVRRAGSALSAGFGVLLDGVIVIFGAVFVASDPDRYRNGIVLLVPKKHTGRTREILSAIGRALQVWLLARFVLMLLLGAIFGVLHRGPAHRGARGDPATGSHPLLPGRVRGLAGTHRRGPRDTAVGYDRGPRTNALRAEPPRPLDHDRGAARRLNRRRRL